MNKRCIVISILGLLVSFLAISQRSEMRRNKDILEGVKYNESIFLVSNYSVERTAHVKSASLEELLKASDIITVHVYLNEETRHMFSRETFEKMKNTALLVNTARGGIVCQEDLIEALKTGQISGACLDVFEEEPLPVESELRDLPNVILTPHTAGMPDGLKFHKTRYEFFRRNIEAVMEGKEVESKLN